MKSVGNFILPVLVIVLCQHGEASIFNWFWGSGPEDTSVLVADGVPLISIPYESMTEDEKFLREAAKFTEIQASSPLETCQHKVIMKIRTSCSDMTEEQIAKLSVNLLNCQSAVEGRKMFPCTDEMSLKQCTTDMDADMWNAYHLMSNRARAVCYSARSTQFRALTELTVNKLMQSAHSQIETLSSLKESQDRLEEQTTEALSSLSEGNQALLQQQEHLRDAQISAHNLVTTNLRDLSNERALIRMGHAQLAAMAEDIRNKLEKASQDIIQQAMERGENHKEVLQDLMNIQEQAQTILDKIEVSTSRIFEQHEQAIEQYEQTLQKLTQINDTIQFIWNLTNTMRSEIDQKLSWLNDYIGNTGEQLQRISHITLHIVYLLLAMIVASFLQAPFLTRATIMGLIPINLASYLKHGMDASLDFTSITALICLITAMHFVMVGVQHIFASKHRTTIASEPVKMLYTNGHTNGDAHKYTSSSYSNSVPKVPLHKRLLITTREIYSAACHQINQFQIKFVSLVQSAASWSRQNLSEREELSCSYLPSKKSREDILYNGEHDFPSMSEDITDFETSNLMHEKHDSFNDSDNITDAQELRRRLTLRRANVSVSRVPPMRQSISRSVTPSSGIPRMLCNGITRSGRQCRLFATSGQDFCSRHSTGSSIMGD
ncbi:hypothetical protein KM043_012930 [Ampulex compressa]|nr:hypothetical protein KM043_012930 [Ampulex compressa]